jgi:hypothetical protein
MSDEILNDPLVYDEDKLCVVFAERSRRRIRQWLRSGVLPARYLPDGRAIVLRDELLEALKTLPMTPPRGRENPS